MKLQHPDPDLVLGGVDLLQPVQGRHRDVGALSFSPGPQQAGSRAADEPEVGEGLRSLLLFVLNQPVHRGGEVLAAPAGLFRHQNPDDLVQVLQGDPGGAFSHVADVSPTVPAEALGDFLTDPAIVVRRRGGHDVEADEVAAAVAQLGKHPRYLLGDIIQQPFPGGIQIFDLPLLFVFAREIKPSLPGDLPQGERGELLAQMGKRNQTAGQNDEAQTFLLGNLAGELDQAVSETGTSIIQSGNGADRLTRLRVEHLFPPCGVLFGCSGAVTAGD